MSVRKRAWTTRRGEAKEAWIVDYTDGTGKRRIRTFARKKEADAYAAKAKVEVGAGTHVALSSDLAIADAAMNWLKRVESDGRERSTVSQYRRHVDLHIAPRIGRLKLAKLTSTDIERFRDALLADLSRAMARKVLVSLKSLLKIAHCGHYAANVSIKKSQRAQRKVESGRDFPTPNEIKRLIQAVANKPRAHALLLTAALTGLRASELYGLRWSDVDLKAEELHVRQRADRYGMIGAPKTAESRRTVPLAPEVLFALKQWKLACPKGEQNLVFPTSTGAVESHSNTLRSLRAVMRDAGVVTKDGKSKYGLHAFRHFFASWCINPKERGGRELSPKLVQTLLGHSSITMTLDVYGHLFPSGSDRSELKAASAALLA